MQEAMGRVESEFEMTEDVRRLLDFIRASKRGVGSGRGGGE